MLYIDSEEQKKKPYKALKAKIFIDEIKYIHLQVQGTLKKSLEKCKARHDQHIIEKTFKLGDQV